jgi:hypothetical protein
LKERRINGRKHRESNFLILNNGGRTEIYKQGIKGTTQNKKDDQKEILVILRSITKNNEKQKLKIQKS